MCLFLKLLERKAPFVRMLAAVAALWLAETMVQGQIIYLSDNRSVNAAVAFDTNSLATQGYGVLSSSGYSASASPSSPFADFSTSQAGSAYVSYTYPSQILTNTSTDTVRAGQTSILNAQGIVYESSVLERGEHYYELDSLLESSYLQVTFMVVSEVTYSLTCFRGWDLFFSSESWNLSSANQGVLVSTPSVNDFNNGYGPGPAVSYSGMLMPGDIYTLTLQEIGGESSVPNGESGLLQVEFSVPEPAVSWLLGVGLCGLIAFRFRRSPRQLVRVVSRAGRKL